MIDFTNDLNMEKQGQAASAIIVTNKEWKWVLDW